MKTKKLTNIEHEISSGNVFADLGFENPEEELAKAGLTIQINNLIKQKNLTQKAASELLGMSQPKISALRNGKLGGFSLERLFRALNDLGQDVKIHIRPKAVTRKKGHLIINNGNRSIQTPLSKHTKGK